MAQSGRAATKVPEPRMEHGLNTERESALMALEKEEITEKISSQLHLKGLFWESVFNPCSIRGSPEDETPAGGLNGLDARRAGFRIRAFLESKSIAPGELLHTRDFK